MPSEKPARRLEDIIENAHAIQRYIAGMGLAAFEKDHKTYDAVERCLERISEAAAKLGDLAPALMEPWQAAATAASATAPGCASPASCRTMISSRATL